MSKFEFRGFTPTPAEKHLGIAEVKVHGETPFVIRFKIVARKDGNGYFPNIASYKMPNRMQGEEYDEACMLDSRSDHDACVKIVMHNVNLYLQAKQPSVFTPQPQQPYPGQQYPNNQQFEAKIPEVTTFHCPRNLDHVFMEQNVNDEESESGLPVTPVVKKYSVRDG